MSIEQQINKYAATHSNLLCVYLFGSVAAKKDNKFSDVDIAVLFKPSVDQKEYFSQRLALIDDLSRVLNKNVDVVILNQANSFLKFQVFKYGLKVYEQPGRGERCFEARAIIEYFDFLPIRSKLEKAMIENIRRVQ